jgi:predicted enzyme related to lactoylglutathione lyase
MATIVHFEIPSENIERAKKFYNGLFGWKMEKMPGPMDYWTFSTTNDKNRDQQQNVSGGVMERQMPQQSITNYI